MYQFKPKDWYIKPYPLCLVNILNNFTIDNMKKTGWSIVKAFSADYDTIDTNYFLDFHRNSMKEIWSKIMVRFV